MHGLELESVSGELRLRVHVKPRASKSRIVGVREGALDVAVAAPPVDGEANEELIRFLAAKLRAKKKDIAIVSGATARTKLVTVRGLSPADAVHRLAPGEPRVDKGR